MKSYSIQEKITKHVFRAYDIRGIVGQDINENSFYTIGLAVGSILSDQSKSTVVLGFDGRLTSDALSEALSMGLRHAGINVVSVGLVPTPVLYYSLHHLKIDSGLMVTGSHNAKDYNGIKLVLNGATLTADEIQGIYQRILQKKFTRGEGTIETRQVIDSYIENIKSRVVIPKKLTIAIDCGNGVAGLFAGRLFRELGAEVHELFCEPDGRFPNHHPDPSVEKNLEALRDYVLEHQCDIGFAFDGDADRLGVIDDQGRIIRPDRVLMLLAKDVLSRHKSAKIVYDVKCSRFLKQLVEQEGGEAIMCPTGHSIVKATMKSTGALLAGEMSGHLFFKEKWYGFDDALYAGVRLLDVLSGHKEVAHELFNALPHSESTAELKVPITEENKFLFIDRIKKEIDFSPGLCNFMDGVRCEFPLGWGLIRASNTTPFLVMRFEANTKQALSDIKTLFKQKLLSLDNSLELPF